MKLALYHRTFLRIVPTLIKCFSKAVADGPVGQVLAGPLFLIVKQSSILQKQIINKSTRVIFGLVQLVIL